MQRIIINSWNLLLLNELYERDMIVLLFKKYFVISAGMLGRFWSHAKQQILPIDQISFSQSKKAITSKISLHMLLGNF